MAAEPGPDPGIRGSRVPLSGRTAVVTGAGRGIGQGIATLLAESGARVVAVDRDGAAASRTADRLARLGFHAMAITADVGSERDVDAMVDGALERFGSLDVLVANAGVGFHRSLLDLELQDWERVLCTNLTGCFLCVQRAARVMARQGRGSIVVVGSTSGQRGAMARTAYGVSKAGVMQLMRIAAVELSRYGIRVNAVAPGPITTPLSDANHTATQRRAYLERIPLKRYGNVEEVASAVLFLASDASSYVNGHVLNVDGGLNEAGLMFDAEPASGHAAEPR